MGDVEKYLVEQVASPIVSSKSCKIIYGYKPKPFKFNLEGASNTAKFLSEIYNES